MAGKGSRQRPTNKQKFDESFDRIFKTKEKPKPLTDDEIVGDMPGISELLKTQAS